MDPLWPADDVDPIMPASETRRDEFRTEYRSMITENPLTTIEQSLIAKNAVYMQVFRLKSRQTAFKGNVITFPQRISDIANTLPRLPSTIKVFVVRVKGSQDPKDFHEFKVWSHVTSSCYHYLMSSSRMMIR